MTKLGQTFEIRLGGEAFELRPSLRYALELAGRAGGFAKLASDLEEGSLGAVLDIVTPHIGYEMPYLSVRVFEAMGPSRAALRAYLLACAGIDPDAPKPEGGSYVPFTEYLTGLYRIGTGWLGWTPDETLDATPLEIEEAYRGRIDMLKAIFGGGDDASPADLDAKARLVFGGSTKKVTVN